MKKVSIIIPCYNHASFIEKAVDSARSQTYGNKEIIVIDDGSNKETKAVLKKLDSKIDHLITQENKGVVAARNIGIQKATGEYILTLDADDYFEPEFLKKAVEILDTEEMVGMVTCWACVEKPSGEKTMQVKPTGANAFEGLFKFNASASLLFRKRCWKEVGGYDSRMKLGYEDWEFAIAIGKKGWQIKVIPEVLFHFVRIPGSRNIQAKAHYQEIRKYVYIKHQDLLINNFEKTLEYFFAESQSLQHQIKELRNSRSYKNWRFVQRVKARLKRIIGKK